MEKTINKQRLTEESFDFTDKLFGCNGVSGDQQNTDNNGGVDWSKYKPANQ